MYVWIIKSQLINFAIMQFRTYICLYNLIVFSDVFSEKNLMKLSKQISPKKWRELGTYLLFSSADLDRFEIDNYDSQNAIFQMLLQYR
jgi:hypothetical protein